MPACARIDLSRPGPIVSPACRGIVTRPLRSGCLSCTCEPLWATTSHPRRRSAFMISRPVRRGSGGTLLPYGDRAWMVAATRTRTAPKLPCGSRRIQPELNTRREFPRKPPDSDWPSQWLGQVKAPHFRRDHAIQLLRLGRATIPGAAPTVRHDLLPLPCSVLWLIERPWSRLPARRVWPDLGTRDRHRRHESRVSSAAEFSASRGGCERSSRCRSR